MRDRSRNMFVFAPVSMIVSFRGLMFKTFIKRADGVIFTEEVTLQVRKMVEACLGMALEGLEGLEVLEVC